MGWTVLRDEIYAEIILVALGNALKSGQLYTATGSGARNYVTREDCAAVAAAALASDFDGRRILEVTGPAPVTQDQVAAWTSAISGRTVTHVPLPADAPKAPPKKHKELKGGIGGPSGGEKFGLNW